MLNVSVYGNDLLFPASMEVKGDLLSNWTFFKDQWEDNEVATGLREKSKNVRVATEICYG